MSIYNWFTKLKESAGRTVDHSIDKAKETLDTAYNDQLQNVEDTIKNSANDVSTIITKHVKRKAEDAQRYARSTLLNWFPIKHPDRPSVYAIDESDSAGNSLPDYAGPGINKDKDKKPVFTDYDNTILRLNSAEPSDYSSPSAGSYLKWGLGGGTLGAAAAAAYTSLNDDEYKRMSPDRRRQRLLRNIALGTGGGALLALASKYLTGN